MLEKYLQIKKEYHQLMNNSGIYKLYWNNNDYFYIGQSINIDKRFKKHINRAKSNKHENNIIQNLYNKYQEPQIEVLELCDVEVLDSLEQSYLDQYYGKEFCCNICAIASSTKGYKHTDESKKIIGKKSKLKVFTEEYREKLRNRSVNKSMLGKLHTDEAKQKMSDSRKGKSHSEEHLNNLRKSAKTAFRKNARILIDNNTGTEYESIREAGRQLNIERSTLAYRIKNIINYHIQYKI